MEFHKIFALLDENDVVQDVILAEDINVATKIALDCYTTGRAIQVNGFDVRIGDFYRCERFYRPQTPGDYNIGFEVDNNVPYKMEIENLNNIIENKNAQIEYLEKLLRDNGLENLI